MRVVRVGAALVALALVLVPGVAAAHPNVIASGRLEAGRSARLTFIILGDEGAFHGTDITFPVSFHLADAHPIGTAFGTPVIEGQTVHLSGFTVAAGQIGQLYVDGTPTVSGPLSVAIVSHLDSGQDYTYPPLAVHVGGRGGSSWGKALPAGLIAVVGGLLGVGYVVRRRRS